jgi:hypothetical protein
MKEYEMGEKCRKNGSDKKRTHNFSRKTSREETTWGDLGDGRILLKWILEEYGVK